MRGLWMAGLLVLGGCQAREPAPTPQIERFKIVYGPVAGWQTFLVDTQTGKTWMLTKIVQQKGGEGRTVFLDVPKQDRVEPGQAQNSGPNPFDQFDDQRVPDLTKPIPGMEKPITGPK